MPLSRGVLRCLRRLAVGAGASLLLAGVAVAQADVTYAYDGQGRVVQAYYNNGAIIAYAYDAAGNRTTVSVTGPSPTIWGSFTWGSANWHN
jgi:YD repeat-containing protein